MNARLAAALAYAAAGHRALPLDGKLPLVPGWQRRASSNRDVILGWWREWPDANVGLLCGHGLLVLDVDGENAQRELERLQAQHGPLPATAVVASGRDGYGRHHYFRAPAGTRSWTMWPPTGSEDDGDLRVLAAGRQVVAPPSLHPDTGREYVWLDRPRLAPAPGWLLARKPEQERSAFARVWTDPLMRVPATAYVPLLLGRQPGHDGKVECPFHSDWRPSLHVYGGDGGWYCFQCERGGTIIDLAAELWGTGTRGDGYLETRRRLVDLLLEGVAA